MAPPLVTKKHASSNMSPYSASAATSASNLLADVQMSGYDSRRSSVNNMEDIEPTSEASTNAEASSSSSAAMAAPPSTNIWSKRKPLSPRNVILRPLVIDLPEPKENEALFFPHDAERLWYLGFLKPWKDFNTEAIRFWNTERCSNAFDDIKPYPMGPSVPDPDITNESDRSDLLLSHFRGEILEIMENVYNKLMEFSRLQHDDVPNELFSGDPDEEDIGNAEMRWNPSYVVKASRDGGNEDTRIIGQVEYLGGRKAALTWAVKECARNSWGSLRCVLGKLSAFLLIRRC
jgi:hypothetical protein